MASLFWIAFLFFCQGSLWSCSASTVFHSARDPFFQGELGVDVFSLEISEGTYLQATHPTVPGNYSVAFFLPGANGDLPAIMYDTLIEAIASHGVIVATFTFFPPRFPFDSVWKNLADAIDWSKKNLNKELPTGVQASFDSAVGMCHSAGCKTLVKVLDEECEGLQAVILLNPVDGMDPWGIIDDYVITPGQKVNFTIPALIMGSGLEGIPAEPFLPACGPDGRNSKHFFDAWRTSAWFLNATKFGHADILDPMVQEASEYVSVCSGGSRYLEHYWVFLSGIVNTFIKGIVWQECHALKALTTLSKLPIKDVLIETNLDTPCPLPGCTNLNR